jgi:hypothetical protein
VVTFLKWSGTVTGDFANKLYMSNLWSAGGQNNLHFTANINTPAAGNYSLVVIQGQAPSVRLAGPPTGRVGGDSGQTLPGPITAFDLLDPDQYWLILTQKLRGAGQPGPVFGPFEE